MVISLRLRFLLSAALLFLLGGAAGYRFVVWYADEVEAALGHRLVERSALHATARIHQTISDDVLLARHVVSSRVVRAWAAAESDARLRDVARSELEDARPLFQGQNLFIALAGSGNYYYLDEEKPGGLSAPRYRLSPDEKKDGWFYATLKNVESLQLNVDTDRFIGVTQVWINAIVRDAAGRPVAVAGTGVPLDSLLDDIVRGREQGVANVLIDERGAIQAHPDLAQIDFASARKADSGEARRTLFQLLDRAGDADKLRAAMAEVASGKRAVVVLPLRVQGRDQLAGVAWVPEARWHAVTLMDAHPRDARMHLPTLLLVLVGSLAVVLVFVLVALQVTVFRRLSALDEAVQHIAAGRFDTTISTRPGDEIGRLGGAIAEMTRRLGDRTQELERQVAERTAELEGLEQTDSVTGALNRRGMSVRLGIERARHAREEQRIGLVLVSLDGLADIAGRLGPPAVDAALVGTAKALRAAMRPYQPLCRWDASTFLVAVYGLSRLGELEAVVGNFAHSLRHHPVSFQGQAIDARPVIGAYLSRPDLAPEAMVAGAERALAAARGARGSGVHVAD